MSALPIGTSTRPPGPAPAHGQARGIAALGVLGIVGTVVLIGALHVIPETARSDPFRRTISEYALSDLGWVFELGVVLLAAGSMAVLAALLIRRMLPVRSAGTVLVTVWSVSLVMLVIFQKHNWAVGPSTEGQVHRVFSLLAFVSLPLAVLSIVKHHRRDGGRDLAARFAQAFGWLSLAWFSVLIGAVVLAPFTGTPWYRAIPLGTVERGLALSEVLAVVMLGFWALGRRAGRTASPA